MNVSTALFAGRAVDFSDNSAAAGGGLSASSSRIMITTEKLSFVNNSVWSGGGGISMETAELQVNVRDNNKCSAYSCCTVANSSSRALSANFVNNTAKRGGAMYTINSIISFGGDVNIRRNSFSSIHALESEVSFTGTAVFTENYDSMDGGGAIKIAYKTVLCLSGRTLFQNNKAVGNGGAIIASHGSPSIILSNNVTFTSNKAENGGAMYFENGATVTLKEHTTLTTSYNHATKYGGAIYHRDSITPSQCEFDVNKFINKPSTNIPTCFIQFLQVSFTSYPFIVSLNDSAGSDGSFLYGGLLDKCLVSIHDMYNYPYLDVLYIILVQLKNLNIESEDNAMTKPITSEAYQLCFCTSNEEYNCSDVKHITTYRGRRFTMHLLALAQADSISSMALTLRAKLSKTASLKQLNQISQILSPNCNEVSYNLYSTEEWEELVVYLDGSTCHDIGLARAAINVTFLPCPDSFTLSGDQCVCEERLQAYNPECRIFDDKIYITKKAHSNFWLNALFDSSGKYEGLVLYPTCPMGYCKTEQVDISLMQPDIQCDQNRSGVLCGACAANHSAMLGSVKCQVCSNVYLFLLVPFGAAGIALVVFLLLFRLTVATGLINSVILYANIVQANRNLLFPNSTNTNILTVFIAWMNLDLGFQTCFYDGMDAYVQTWLQFAFPIYIWFLISLIILTSRYSMTVTKLIGSNPVAVLATLLLMSYTKVLKIIIEVYSFVELDYPNNKTVRVWRKDANVPYLQSWHLALTVVTTLVLVILFLPYTLLLLLSYKLYRFSGRKHYRWLNRIKPLLDSYYAPYKSHTRYWTGSLLLIRCVLYIIFSFNSVGATTKSLLAINIALSASIIWLLSVKVYSSFHINTIEALVYLNLVILSAADLAGVNSPPLANSLVGIVFALMVGIIVYHFHFTYIAKSTIWLKIVAKLSLLARAAKNHRVTETTPLILPVASTSPSLQRPVATTSVVCLQEPLVDCAS